MRRPAIAIFLVAVFTLSYLVVSTERAMSWSDGVAGSSGAIPLHLRKCAEPFKYCKVKVSGCGGCHGDWEAMQHQRQSEPPVVDRVHAEILIAGSADFWEYEPGKPYVIDLWVTGPSPGSSYGRPEGPYSKAAFNLNVSGGKLELLPRDDTVRLTGGNYSHTGSRNPQAMVCRPDRPTECRPYGQTTDDERQWAGELANTGEGSNISKKPMPGGGSGYNWRAVWRAPPKQEPHGVAFVMSVMLPNGDGVDSCVYVVDNTGCNATKGYSDQKNWDWWTFMIPRKIVCEKGQKQVECNKKVLDFILPPAPPPNTGGTNGPGDDDGGITPGPGTWAILGATLFVVVSRRRRRRPPDPARPTV